MENILTACQALCILARELRKLEAAGADVAEAKNALDYIAQAEYSMSVDELIND